MVVGYRKERQEKIYYINCMIKRINMQVETQSNKDGGIII